MAAMVALVAPGRAASWVLLNGDRVTGELLETTPDTLVIEHPTFGRLQIPRSALAPEHPAAGNNKVTVNPPKPKWHRQIELGFTGLSGAITQRNLSARAQLDGTEGPDTFRATACWTESESAGITVADRRDTDFRWRHDLSTRVFLQTQTTYQADAVRDLDLSLQQQVGAGLRLFDRGGQKVNVGLGVAMLHEERDLTGNETALLGTLFQDYAHAWGDRLRFTQESSLALTGDRTFSAAPSPLGAAPIPADGGNYRVKFNAALQSRVTPQATLNLRYEYDYDRSLPVPDLRGDQRLTTSLGYAW